MSKLPTYYYSITCENEKWVFENLVSVKIERLGLVVHIIHAPNKTIVDVMLELA